MPGGRQIVRWMLYGEYSAVPVQTKLVAKTRSVAVAVGGGVVRPPLPPGLGLLTSTACRR